MKQLRAVGHRPTAHCLRLHGGNATHVGAEGWVLRQLLRRVLLLRGSLRVYGCSPMLCMLRMSRCCGKVLRHCRHVGLARGVSPVGRRAVHPMALLPPLTICLTANWARVTWTASVLLSLVGDVYRRPGYLS